MIHFGKQQEILRDLSTSSPEDPSGTAGRLLIEDGVVVITNGKVWKGSRAYVSIVQRPGSAWGRIIIPVGSPPGQICYQGNIQGKSRIRSKNLGDSHSYVDQCW